MTSGYPYVILGRTAFETPDGRLVRGAFDTSRALLFAVDDRLATVMEDPCRELNAAQVAALVGAGLVPGADTAVHYLQNLDTVSRDLSSRTFILLPTPACNMGCDYCGQIHRGRSLKALYADIVLSRISAAIQRPETDEVHVNWFGGEPLLAKDEILSMPTLFAPVPKSTT